MTEDESTCPNWSDGDCWRPAGHDGLCWDGAAGLVFRDATVEEQRQFLAEMDEQKAILEGAAQ